MNAFTLITIIIIDIIKQVVMKEKILKVSQENQNGTQDKTLSKG